MSRINIEIANNEYQMLKIVAAATSSTVKDLVLSAIKEKVYAELHKQPSIETLEAFRDTDTGNVFKHTNIKSLFDDLGLYDSEVN